MAWNSLTNQRAVQTTIGLVVEICHQMEGWRRLLRHVERIDHERAREEHERSEIQRSRGKVAMLRRSNRRNAA